MYDNILKALSQPKPSQQKQLSLEEKNRNYQLFDELMKKGISLDDLLKAADGRKEAPGIEAGVFTVMEEAVKEDEKVAEFRKKASDLKSQIITEICLKDDRYRTALEEYRKAVSEAYVRSKEEIKSEAPIGG